MLIDLCKNLQRKIDLKKSSALFVNHESFFCSKKYESDRQILTTPKNVRKYRARESKQVTRSTLVSID